MSRYSCINIKYDFTLDIVTIEMILNHIPLTRIQGILAHSACFTAEFRMVCK